MTIWTSRVIIVGLALLVGFANGRQHRDDVADAVTWETAEAKGFAAGLDATSGVAPEAPYGLSLGVTTLHRGDAYAWNVGPYAFTLDGLELRGTLADVEAIRRPVKAGTTLQATQSYTVAWARGAFRRWLKMPIEKF